MSSHSRSSSASTSRSSPSRGERRVRFAEEHTAHYYEHPSPAHSDRSLPESFGPQTPPQQTPLRLPISIPTAFPHHPYQQPYPPAVHYSPQYHHHSMISSPLSSSPPHISSYSPPRAGVVIDVANIHPVLAYTSTPALSHDVAFHPETIFIKVKQSMQVQLTESDVETPATKPGLHSLRIRCTSSSFPWIITIPAGATGEVSVGDVLGGLYKAFRTNVSKEDMDRCPRDKKERVLASYQKRTRGDEKEKAKGVKRVDFLGDKTKWCGLAKSKDYDLWDLILSK